MMPTILFLGVGEACDHWHANTSVLCTTPGCQFLCDCGFTVPHRLFAHLADPDSLDAVWISHFHGDHFFGTPLLMLRLWDMGRTKALTFIGQPGLREKIEAALELAYPGFASRLEYPVRYLITESGTSSPFEDLTLTTVETEHGQPNQGLLITAGTFHIYYSGDGRPTPEVRRLIRGADLVIHESFSLEKDIHNHGSISGCLELAQECEARRFALTHLERNTRLRKLDQINAMLASYPSVFIPEEGDRLELG